MATFTPPTESTVPPYLPETRGPARALMRHGNSGVRGRNVYILTNGTVTENDPDGTTVTWADVAHVFWGGHAAETVTAAERALLIGAGYTVDD